MTKLIIEIPDEALLDIAAIIKSKGGQVLTDCDHLTQDEREGSLWSSLNDEQKQEVLLAYEESEIEENLVDAKIVFKNLK